MFCGSCGAKNEEDFIFCEKCGAKFLIFMKNDEHDEVTEQLKYEGYEIIGENKVCFTKLEKNNIKKQLVPQNENINLQVEVEKNNNRNEENFKMFDSREDAFNDIPYYNEHSKKNSKKTKTIVLIILLATLLCVLLGLAAYFIYLNI